MKIYNIIRKILYIIIFFISIINKKTRIFFKKRLFQNFKNLDFFKNNKNFILIHLSSVGEFNLSKEFISELFKKNEKIIISIMTDTGIDTAKKFYKNEKNIEIIYFPLDDRSILKKLYSNYNIKKTIIIETEIWPNLYEIAEKYSTLFIINGRLTDKKVKQYLKFKNFIKKIINKPKKILVQSEEDRERYIKIGVNKNKLYVYKNLKYSIKYKILSNEEKEKYSSTYLLNRKVIVCGSTRPNEEKIWLNIFKKININNEYQLIIIPRHLDRIEEIKTEIEKEELLKNNYSLFSENKKTDIIIVDKMGILVDFYQLADIVFVGGTLVDIGGHSILEPLYYGKIPIIGKFYQNIESIVNDAKKLDFIKIVDNENDIINKIEELKNIEAKDFFNKNNDILKILNEIYK